MKNKDILDNIIGKLEKEHLNLYHDISKDEVQKHLNSIKNIDMLSNKQFDLEMLKLFAMFKDGHTVYNIPLFYFDKQMIFLQNKFYVYHNDEWKEISAFGKIDSSKFRELLSQIISYETPSWFEHCILKYVNNGYVYEILGLLSNQSLQLTTINNEQILLSKSKDSPFKRARQKCENYSYKILESGVLYLRYKRCIENPNYKFISFVEDLKNEIKEKHITKYILDVRNNVGGNSRIIKPLVELVKSENLYGVMLIDSGVFSSGRFAVADFKKEFNITLIGEQTGGASKSYGNVKDLEVNGKSFSVSTRLWDFSKIFGYEGAIQPDIFVPLTFEDFKNNEDKKLSCAIKFLSHSDELNSEEELTANKN